MHGRRFTDIAPVAPVIIVKDEVETGRKKKTKKQAKTSKKSSKMSSPRTQKPQQQPKGPRTELDYEIERLKAEIQQERQMK